MAPIAQPVQKTLLIISSLGLKSLADDNSLQKKGKQSTICCTALQMFQNKSCKKTVFTLRFSNRIYGRSLSSNCAWPWALDGQNQKLERPRVLPEDPGFRVSCQKLQGENKAWTVVPLERLAWLWFLKAQNLTAYICISICYYIDKSFGRPPSSG